jgi:hypothetical protein
LVGGFETDTAPAVAISPHTWSKLTSKPSLALSCPCKSRRYWKRWPAAPIRSQRTGVRENQPESHTTKRNRVRWIGQGSPASWLR